MQRAYWGWTESREMVFGVGRIRRSPYEHPPVKDQVLLREKGVGEWGGGGRG